METPLCHLRNKSWLGGKGRLIGCCIAGVLLVSLWGRFYPGAAPICPRCIQLLLMPFCPYGREALQDLLRVRDRLPKGTNIKVYYIAEALISKPASNADFRSLHGSEEVKAGIVAVVVEYLYPNQYLDYLASALEVENWHDAARRAGIDSSLIEAYIDSQQAIDCYMTNISFARNLNVSLCGLSHFPHTFLGSNRIAG